MKGRIKTGLKITAPFGKRHVSGVVTGSHANRVEVELRVGESVVRSFYRPDQLSPA
ncbi:hypothetical protein A3Q40_01147 [Rhodococcus sp. PBTS 1]|nr:hypothetical protein A3Q40_01147 [Rhodococcus sp. PBTS 1]